MGIYSKQKKQSGSNPVFTVKTYKNTQANNALLKGESGSPNKKKRNYRARKDSSDSSSSEDEKPVAKPKSGMSPVLVLSFDT